MIYENVSTFRNIFVKMKEKLEEELRLKEQMYNENNTLKTELDVCRKVANNTDTESNRKISSDRDREPTLTSSRQVQPFHGCRNANSTSTQTKRETPRDREMITPNTTSSQQRPSIGSTPRLYSDVAAERYERKFKLTDTTKRTYTPNEVQNSLKEKVRLTDIKVGVQSLKALKDGREIIEVVSKKEMELLEEGFRERCGEELETNILKPRKPRLVILNTPSEITMENVEETLIKQNTEIKIQEGSIVPKFNYTTKRGTRNLVVEMHSETRKKLQQIRVKLGWTICRLDDNVSVKRCYRCSRFNHNHR